MARAIYLSGKEWVTQLPIDYLDTSLTVDGWETVSADLSGGLPARIWYMIIEQTNNGAAVENFEIELTINGTAYTFSRDNIPSGADFFGLITHELDTGDFDTYLDADPRTMGSRDGDHAVPFIAQYIGLIRVRQTTAVDVGGAQIEVNIVWDRFEDV